MLWTRYPVVFIEATMANDPSIGRKNVSWVSLCLAPAIHERILLAGIHVESGGRGAKETMNVPAQWGLCYDDRSPLRGGAELLVNDAGQGNVPWVGFRLIALPGRETPQFSGTWLELDKFFAQVRDGRRYFGSSMPDDSLRDLTLGPPVCLDDIRP